jgi:hypothetical protein
MLQSRVDQIRVGGAAAFASDQTFPDPTVVALQSSQADAALAAGATNRRSLPPAKRSSDAGNSQRLCVAEPIARCTPGTGERLGLSSAFSVSTSWSCSPRRRWAYVRVVGRQRGLLLGRQRLW